MRLSTTALRLDLGVVLALALCLARPAHAQDVRTGSLTGRVVDSTHARPLTGARVVAVGTDARDAVSRAATTDSAGRYRIDSLPAGRYAVGLESPLLDSLEIALSPREVTLGAGQTATIDLAFPPSAKLLGALCPGITLPAQTGVLLGHVVDAESENPLADAVLALSWQERGVDRYTLKPVNAERTASATADSSGWYRLCGVPTDTWLSLQLQYKGGAGPVIRAMVGDTLGVAVRYLSFAVSSLRPEPDSAAARPVPSNSPAPASTAPTVADAPALLSGTAKLTGIVRGTGDVPLASAEVRVRGARGTGKTDVVGRYTLTELPDGTQVLDVRHVGYAPAEVSVELRSGVMVTSDVRMQRVVNLDSIRVVATRVRYKEFNEMQKNKIMGVFLGPDEMEWRWRVAYSSDVIKLIPGYKIVGEGRNQRVINGRGAEVFRCSPNIVIDGQEDMSINDVEPVTIGAIAAYRMGDQGPPEYDRGCGAIIIWTKR